MAQYGPSIKDRFRKSDSIYHPLKRKKKILERLVAQIKKYKGRHIHMREKARRLKQISRGILKVENGLVRS